MPLGLAGERELPLGGRRQLQAGQLLFQHRVAQQKAQRRTQVVQLLGRNALDLRVAARIEPGVFAVEQEELAGGLGVLPAHTPRFDQQQRSTLGAAHPHALVALREAGAERVKLVVVAVDALGNIVRAQ